jgi:ABC-2 type transport system permease protein
MNGATHVRIEIIRTLRNRRILLLAYALPLVVFYAVAAENRHNQTEGIGFPLYFMTAMAAYGAMWAAVSPGGHIAIDRSRGWIRQLRITPLRIRTEMIAKVLAAYLVVLPTLVLMYVAGVTLGVHLDAAEWLEMTGLLLIGVAPFVAAGIALGHLLNADALAPVLGGFVVVLGLFGGAFGLLFQGGVMLTIVKLLPSYWLVQGGKTAVGSGSWPAEGWIVVGVSTLCLVSLAALAFKHDKARV